MLAVLAQIDGYDPVANAAVTLYAANIDDAAVCHLNGQTWWPAIAKAPTLRYDLFDGAFAGQIVAPASSLSLRTEPWADFARYALADARLRLWTGEAGDAWGGYTLRFDGRVTAQPQSADGAAEVSFAVDDRWLDGALLSLYAGTTGAEGPAAMKGQPKPLAIGAPRYIPGKLIDSVNIVFQLSAYGAIQGVEAALERLARYGSPTADYASYAALIAASVPAGRWATCLAQGLVRFGAPTAGQISFLAQGDKAGPDGWARTPGKVIRRLALLSGGAGKIDDASLNALDVARPYNVSVYVEEQTTARQLIQALAASVNAVAGMSWTGQLFVAPIAVGAPTSTLAADGSALPPVASVAQIGVAAPFKSLGLSAERAWTVHALSDIAFTATLIDMGAYVAGQTYREGNIVQDQGTSWVYINPAPSSGNAPPALPTLSNDYWKALVQPASGMRVQGSVNGTSSWHEPPVAGDAYLRFWDEASGTWGSALPFGGENALVGLLTNESATVAAANDGAVTSGALASAGGTFRVYYGLDDVTASCSFTRVSQSGLSLTIGASTGVYTISAASADTGTATLRATFAGISIDKVYSLAKSKAGATGGAGADGSDAKLLVVISDRQTITYDGTGAVSPSSQTTTFSTQKQNTTATVTWTMTRLDGTSISSASYLSDTTGNSVTMTASAFNTARGSTNGVIVIGTLTDGTTLTDRISIVRVQAGTNGTNGAPGPAGPSGDDGIGTTTLATVGSATVSGGQADCSTNAGGSWESHSVYSTQIAAGSASLSWKAPNAYGDPTDFFMGLRSAPSTTFTYSSFDIGAIRFASYNTGIGSATSYHTEIWIGNSAVAFDKTWDGSYTYSIRYDAPTGRVRFFHTTPGGVVTLLYSGSITSGKSTGVQAIFARRGRATNIAYGPSGDDGSATTGGDVWIGYLGKEVEIILDSGATAVFEGQYYQDGSGVSSSGSGRLEMQWRYPGGGWNSFASVSGGYNTSPVQSWTNAMKEAIFDVTAGFRNNDSSDRVIGVRMVFVLTAGTNPGQNVANSLYKRVS
jgi:hypothetical protein